MKAPVDTHAHLSMLQSRGIDPHPLLAELFAESGGAGDGCAKLSGIIDVSLESGDLAARIEEFSRYGRIRFASGLWPHAGSIEKREELVPALRQSIQDAPAGMVCALGEFGLDHHYESEDHSGIPDSAGERELMEMQMEAARELSLPVIIHSRDAPQETAEILRRYPGQRGVIHCFSYDPRQAKIFLDMGYYISFAGNITFKNAQPLRECCAFIPDDALLLETDCPYLAPVPFRGKPAHPGMVESCYKTAADVRGSTPEKIAELVAQNANRLFGTDF